MAKLKLNWKKIFSVIAWSLTGLALIVLLVAAGTHNNQRQCKGIVVNIISSDDVRYIQEKEILSVISEGSNNSIVGKYVGVVNLKKKEELLEKNLWIRNADLYFDHQDRLQVMIEQRIPVARVFCKDQSTFYVDDQGVRLPFSFTQIASVPVFTSFPESSQKLNAKDSLLLMQVRDMGLYLHKEPFWKALIDQIELNANEMVFVPKVGNHEILFGEGNMIKQKFRRLKIFYDQIISKTGWNYYSRLDLRFNKLLVGVRRDSLSLFANMFMPADSLSKVQDSLLVNKDSTLIKNADSVKIIPPVNPGIKDTVKLKPAVKTQSQPVIKTNADVPSGKSNTTNQDKPKAIMAPVINKDTTNLLNL
jgi:cell division protein FtsQ